MRINIRYVFYRLVTIALLAAAAYYLVGFAKRKHQQAGIVSELKSLTSDSSFFNQFSAGEAGRSLVRAVGLIAEANNAGMEPEQAIEHSLGIKKKYFAMDDDKDGPNARQLLIIKSLRANYENFRKFGYQGDPATLRSMRKGILPPVEEGLRSGTRAQINYIISPSLSPGLEKVLANLQIQPARTESRVLTDTESAAAKALVVDLRNAEVIESVAERRIISALDAHSAGPE